MLLILVFVFGALAAVTGLWGFFFAAALAFIARRIFPVFLAAFIVLLLLLLL